MLFSIIYLPIVHIIWIDGEISIDYPVLIADPFIQPPFLHFVAPNRRKVKIADGGHSAVRSQHRDEECVLKNVPNPSSGFIRYRSYCDLRLDCLLSALHWEDGSADRRQSSRESISGYRFKPIICSLIDQEVGTVFIQTSSDIHWRHWFPSEMGAKLDSETSYPSEQICHEDISHN
jgi:hypothetical protein